jgi:hypothetical protein
MIAFLLPIFWCIYALIGQPISPADAGADYRYYQSAVRNLPVGPLSPAYAVCDMMETFTGLPAGLDAENLRAHERDHNGAGALATFYQYMLERKGLLRVESERDSTNEDDFTHYICPTGSVLSFAEASKINAPNKIVSLLNQGIKAIVVTYAYCPKDWKNGVWKLGEAKEKHRPKAFHTVLIVGHRDSSFIFKNAWGNTWGENGYGTISFAYHRRHAREGIVTYLAEAVEPKILTPSTFSLKTQPELLEGKPYLQVSLVPTGPGRLPSITALDYALSTGGTAYDVKKALLIATAKRNGFPCLLEMPRQDAVCSLLMRYAAEQPTAPLTIALGDLKWVNAEIPLKAK